MNRHHTQPVLLARLAALAVLVSLAASTATTLLTTRLKQLDTDRGDVPGWAIASGAACVLALAVYTAYTAVINKWIGKIQ